MKKLIVFENSDGDATIEIRLGGGRAVSYDFDSWDEAIEALPNIEEL